MRLTANCSLAALPPDVLKASGLPAERFFILPGGEAQPRRGQSKWQHCRKGMAIPHIRRRSRVRLRAVDRLQANSLPLKMFLNRRPSPQKIKNFLERSQGLPLSYEPIGIARESPRGFKIDEASSIIGQGGETFVRAKQALTNWQQFELSWVELHPHGAPIEVGTVVAVVVRHLGFWSLNGCRIVYLTDEDEMKYGFAYGTLANHAELGEEIFEVSFDPNSKEVTYRIRAVSKARAAAARLGYPYTRFLQDSFRRDSITAMRRAVS